MKSILDKKIEERESKRQPRVAQSSSPRKVKPRPPRVLEEPPEPIQSDELLEYPIGVMLSKHACWRVQATLDALLADGVVASYVSTADVVREAMRRYFDGMLVLEERVGEGPKKRVHLLIPESLKVKYEKLKPRYKSAAVERALLTMLKKGI